jgi:hypothetical protein
MEEKKRGEKRRGNGRREKEKKRKREERPIKKMMKRNEIGHLSTVGNLL